jgi:hypothetical protein
MRRVLLVTLLVLAPLPAQAQQMDLEEGIAQAILDLTTTPQRHLWWRPCGEGFRGRDDAAHAYARRIAGTIVRAAEEDLDPWVMTAQLAQESGMNPCVFSSREFRAFRSALGREPTETDILRLLRTPTLRQRHAIHALDAGLAQFRWPGAVARRVGITSPEQLLDIDLSVQAYAHALRRYKQACVTRPSYAGTHVTGQGRVIRWRFACEDVFWAIHNTGDPTNIRYQYIHNVHRRYARGPAHWRTVVEGVVRGG